VRVGADHQLPLASILDDNDSLGLLSELFGQGNRHLPSNNESFQVPTRVDCSQALVRARCKLKCNAFYANAVSPMSLAQHYPAA